MSKVSIIMPVYNGERFLKPAIDSALAQTFADWELIVVDDGSKDSTPEILRQVTDPRVKVIHKQNGGEASARNLALEHACGEYISFLDADDLYLPNALADLTAFLDSHPEYEVVFADGHLCDEQDRKLTRLSEHRPGLHTGNILEPLVLTASVITVPVCTMLRRSVVEQNHIRFDTQFVIGPDWDFWIQVARVARFGNLDRLTCMYRVHLSNITRTSGANRRRDDLIRGREKVMRSDWFSDLSVETRRRFFYNLLVELASDLPDRQLALLQEPAFRQLSAQDQATLWRQVGIDIFRKRGDQEKAELCFKSASRLSPADRKTKMLMRASRLGRLPLQLLLRTWEMLHRAQVTARGIGKKKPKPVPSALGPVKS